LPPGRTDTRVKRADSRVSADHHYPVIVTR
jgi:hypothetical protein